MSRYKFRRPNIGSISTGTLKPEDLIETFVYELRQQRPLHREHRAILRSVEGNMRRMKSPAYFTTEQPRWDVDALIDALEAYAPEGFYFGSHPGDGADFGYWLAESYIDDFDGLRVDDTADVPKGYTGQVLFVNDHGNATLYRASRGKLSEVWSIV